MLAKVIHTLGAKSGKQRKRNITGIITGQGSGNIYTPSISINYKDLISNIVYKNILINFELQKRFEQ